MVSYPGGRDTYKMRYKMIRIRGVLRPLLVTLLSGVFAFGAYAAGLPKLQTNQKLLEEINRAGGLEIKDARAVFSYVFNELPPDVRVYPTENYYYFSFYHNGIKFAGNMRLDAYDRDKGILHFAYFNKFNRWNEETTSEYRQLSKADGVQIEKLDKLQYRVTFKGKSVIFHLNDLTDVKPPKEIVNDWEEYIGPVYDEAGIQFYLLYNKKSKLFHFILNENAPVPDQFSPARTAKNIQIGGRTGFAYYKDRFLDRKILVGVYEGNSMVNNYFDGPFDQLPDNFLKGDQLQKALIDESPELAGQIDRFGNTDEGKSRVLVAPYLYFSHESQLAVFDQCAQHAGDDKTAYYACFKAENVTPADGDTTVESVAPENAGQVSSESADKEVTPTVDGQQDGSHGNGPGKSAE